MRIRRQTEYTPEGTAHRQSCEGSACVYAAHTARRYCDSLGRSCLGERGRECRKYRNHESGNSSCGESGYYFIQSKPEIDDETLASVYTHPALQEISAVKNKRVYAIPFYTIRCPAVRVRDAIEIFAKGLYPKQLN